MSASNEERRNPHADAHGGSDADTWSGRARLSSNDLTQRSSTVIDAQELHRVLECSQLQRQYHYQQLCRHYTSQIRFGCTNPNCQTPTCFSRNNRNDRRPYRAPSQLTAYALASYLASQNHSLGALCPHPLKNPPIETPHSDAGTDISQRYNDTNHEFVVYPTTWRLAQQYRRANDRHSLATASASTTPNASPVHEAPLHTINKQRQVQRDTKSLGQNLYDSLSMMGFFIQQIPNPASVLALLRAPTDRSSHVAPRFERTADGARPIEATDPAAGVALATVIPQTSVPLQAAPDQSQRESLSIDHSHSGRVNSNLARTSHEIHRIPYHAPKTVLGSNGAILPTSSTPNGAPESSPLSLKKTGKKSFPLGGDAESIMGKPKPSTVSYKPNEPWVVDRTAPVLPVYPTLSCDRLDQLKKEVYQHRKYQSAEFNFAVDYDGNRHYQPSTPFVNRSLFFVLSDPDALLNSFHDSNGDFKDSLLPHLDSAHLTHSFRDWNRHNGALVFDSLWVAVEAIFTPPPELDTHQSSKSAERARDSEHLPGDSAEAHGATRYLTTLEAAHIVVICIHALTSLIPVGWPHTWEQIRKLRSWGTIAPSAPPNTDAFTHPFLEIIDELEYEPALRLTDRLLRAIGARMCYEHILIDLRQGDAKKGTPTPALPQDSLVTTVIQHLGVVERVALRNKAKLGSNHTTHMDPGWTVTATFMEWLRTIIIKKWDSDPRIAKWTCVGVAVQLLAKFYTHRETLNLRPVMFEMPFFHERINSVDEPVKFLDWKPSTNQFHLFQYPMLFSTHHLVTYFRTINFTRIFSQYDHTVRTQNVHRSLEIFLKGPHSWLISAYLKTTLLEHLVLRVRRDHVLEDTLDQIWGQEKRLLMKPLKVKLGDGGGGEVGLDHGGVTNEFFSIVLGEAFKPEKGMFTVDPRTRMTWFQPGSLEAPWKFQMLGILFSLAVYNGVTLPVTFPLVFYQLLLPSNSPAACSIADMLRLDFIQDGWPDLAKSLRELLSWSNGDVGDVIMRDYAFSFEFIGQRVDHNMKYPFLHHRMGPTVDDARKENPEPDLVTNANREQFVRDYIRFLILDSIQPQLEAFQKGWAICLEPKSMHLFTPSSLRDLVEGTQHISISELQHIVQYDDGYTTASPTIRAFWTVVAEYNQNDARNLLQFVTASERIPITGYANIAFKIIKIGGAPRSLPTSSTCFGNLYLPDYGDVETLREKLGLAIRNSTGFGII